MPDAELLDLAGPQSSGGPDALGGQVARMIRDPKAQQFVKHFTGQWLGNRKARSVMGLRDNRHVWSELIRYGMVRSTEMFFDEILQQNRSIRTFIDSDFHLRQRTDAHRLGHPRKRGGFAPAGGRPAAEPSLARARAA